MTPIGKGAVVGFLVGEDWPLNWVHTRQFDGKKESLTQIVRFFSENPRAQHIRGRGQGGYLTCSGEDDNFDCGFDIDLETKTALARSDAFHVSRHELGIVFSLSHEIRAETHFLIGYASLNEPAGHIPDCSSIQSRAPRGTCNTSLDKNWVLAYEWFPNAPFQKEQEELVKDVVKAPDDEAIQ